MPCSAKCFLVEMERDGVMQSTYVDARTPANARKLIKNDYGKEIDIISVREKKKTNR